ncbi:hypothetical protein H4J38_03490 [Colwellia sp. BRX10-3]|uniref:hypothetical protein n=1 Tax=Colwellia sp. BRX10-3 TaxID=2759844 RepID=UPI0015F6F41E|nr:hypothetical protein [Colwellia sp. BRX10-3]MBA6389839.1 hypothetical protein [Colwellia sp. BRX10-3]
MLWQKLPKPSLSLSAWSALRALGQLSALSAIHWHYLQLNRYSRMVKSLVQSS